MNGIRVGTARRGVRGLALAIGGALLVAIAGCTDARVVDSWRSPDDHAPTRAWLVVSRAKSTLQRRMTEDAIVARLRSRNVEARASYTRFPEGVPGTNALARALDGGRGEVALVIDPVTTTTESRWVPGYRVSEPRTYYNPWRRSDVTVWRDRWVPGWRQRERVAHVQISAWRGGDDAELLYGCTVEVTDPGSNGGLARDLAAALVPGLHREGLL